MQKYKTLGYTLIALSVLALACAYSLEFFSLHPCKLCIYQRVVYYVLILNAIMIIVLAKKPTVRLHLLLTYLIVMAGIGIAVFQILVEQHIIIYESSCTTKMSGIQSPEDFLSSIQSKDLVACDVPTVIMGLSLSSWNLIYMLFVLCITILLMYKEGFHKYNDTE